MTEQQDPRLDELWARHEQAQMGGGQARIGVSCVAQVCTTHSPRWLRPGRWAA